MKPFSIFILIYLLSQPVWANACPDLNGKYKFVDSPVSMNRHHYMSIEQKDCKFIKVTHDIKVDGHNQEFTVVFQLDGNKYDPTSNPPQETVSEKVGYYRGKLLKNGFFITSVSKGSTYSDGSCDEKDYRIQDTCSVTAWEFIYHADEEKYYSIQIGNSKSRNDYSMFRFAWLKI